MIRKPGVYKITNLLNSKIYVGSSVNIYNRMHLHFSKLRKGKHHNLHLQNAFNKYGRENFSFEILILCPKEYLEKAEQWFLDTLKPDYNILTLAYRNSGRKVTEAEKNRLRGLRKGIKLSPEHIEAIRKAQTGPKHSEESKNKMRVAKLGKPMSLQARRKMSEAKKGKSSWNKGRVTSEETRTRQSESRKRYLQNKNLCQIY